MDGTTAAAADRGDGNIVGRQLLFIKILFLLLSLRLGVLARVILKIVGNDMALTPPQPI
jgi:hypothetical protein